MGALKQHSFQHSGDLFPLASKFRIEEITGKDASRTTDRLLTLKSLIVSSEEMYPKIDRWFDNKVVPGLKSAERLGYVAYEGDKAIASAVLKHGTKAKFCHLRIHQDFHDLDLGQMFFTQMTLEARRYAKEIHFTLPESLWYAKSHFFESFGFTAPTKSNRQYRTGDTELSCSTPLPVAWDAALGRLPNLVAKFAPAGFSLQNSLLLSVKPEYATKIIAGSKPVEIRKRFSTRWLGCRAVIYASRPLSCLVGEATISAVTSGRPKEIWAKYGARVGAEEREFEEYTVSCDDVSAIELTEVTPYISHIPLVQLSHLLKTDLRPPQSFCSLGNVAENPWAAAVAVAALLHGRFRMTQRATL